jgi:hypothetical protein
VGVVGIIVAVAAALAGHPVSSTTQVASARAEAPVSLEVTRKDADPGESVGLIVVNDTPRKVRYGLDTRVQRNHSGRWVDAMKAVYGMKHPGTRSIALYAPPNGRGGSGPVGGGLRDEIVLPKDLRPGRYRAVKRVTVVGRGARTVRATFNVIGPARTCSGIQARTSDGEIEVVIPCGLKVKDRVTVQRRGVTCFRLTMVPVRSPSGPRTVKTVCAGEGPG